MAIVLHAMEKRGHDDREAEQGSYHHSPLFSSGIEKSWDLFVTLNFVLKTCFHPVLQDIEWKQATKSFLHPLQMYFSSMIVHEFWLCFWDRGNAHNTRNLSVSLLTILNPNNGQLLWTLSKQNSTPREVN